jgi:hypothetical protein
MSGPSQAPITVPSGAFPFATLHEVNERCIDLLVSEARAERRPPLPLVVTLRSLLRNMGAETRRRAARQGLLLVDMEFQDAVWWRSVRAQPARQRRPAGKQGSFPPRSATPLVRATLTLACQSLHVDREMARVILGMIPDVAELVANLKLVEMDQIAARWFRHIQPRWNDQPAVWNALLQAAQDNRPRAMQEFSVHGLQLMTGSLLSAKNLESPNRRRIP